jgi:prophage DNA circulation protein
MFKADAHESAGLSDRVLAMILEAAPTRGRPGSDLRTAIGDFHVNAEPLFRSDAAGEPLNEIFDLARAAGITLPQLKYVRDTAVAEEPVSLGATLTKNTLIHLSLATEGRILADTEFVSRDDVNAMKLAVNEAFAPMEEIAADEMDQEVYQALIRLHAAIIYYLVETARPLPRMLAFSFGSVLPTLVQAHRLYADAGRADELRDENKVVHPAFPQRQGRALSK